jgi:hypothetical protein
MPGGWLIGLGQGVSKAGDIYNDAKKQAIDRMFRERTLAMQQQALEDQIRGGEFKDAMSVVGSLPEGTPVEENQFGPGGAPAVRAFSKIAMTPNPERVLGAKSLPMSTGAPTLDPNAAPSDAPVVAGQSLNTPIQQRVSVPTMDSRLRSQELRIMSNNQINLRNDATRNRIADQNNATRQQIASAKMALASQMANTTDLYRQQLLRQGWKRLDDLDKQIANQATFQNAQMNNMDTDNARADAIFEAGGAGAGQNPFMQQMMQIYAESQGIAPPAGGAPGAPGAAPGAPAQKPRVAPKHGSVRDKPGSVHVDPAVAPEATPGTYEWYKAHQGQK